MKIPFHRPTLGEEELKEVQSVLESGWLTTGPKAAQLEQEFRSAAGAPFAAAVSSCTAGLHVALTALGAGPGDEVITTPLTFCATIQAIALTGARPVLADVGCDGNIDPAAVEARITARTKGIVPVRLAGLPCDMERLSALARGHGLFIVEDAAHSDPYCGPPHSDAAVYSFYATKSMTSAEGGMVTTLREDLDRRIRRLSLHGIERAPGRPAWRYEVVEPGFKYNLSDLQAAVGVAQLRRLPETRRRLRAIATYYNARFRDVDAIEVPPGIENPDHSCHLYSIRLNLVKLGMGRDELAARLEAEGIQTSLHFIPIPLHRAYAGLAADLPRAMALYERLLSLPIYPSLTDEQAEYVADRVIAAV